MTVLLDTTVAQGVVGNLYEPAETRTTEKCAQWMDCIESLLKKYQQKRLVIPTPVFFELAARNPQAFQAYQKAYTNRQPTLLFGYCDYSITPRMMWAAARLRSEAGQKHAPSFADALLGAYCLLEEGYCLITCNEKDFSPKYFEVKGMVLAPMPTETSERRVVFLLSPKSGSWS